MTTINADSVENQRICQRLVDREVYYCVSPLVHHFASNEGALDGSDYSYDDILDLCTGRDWESAWDNSGAILVQDSDGEWWVVEEDEKDKVQGLEGEALDAALKELDNEHLFVDEPTLEERCEALGIDHEPMDVYEHWIVSTFLAERLAEKGHPTGELFGMTIWGRPTTGQSIHMDGVIQEIAAEMEILKGQKYDWSRE